MAAAIAGFSTMTKAAPVSDMDLDISGLGQISYSWSENTNNDGLDIARLRLNFAAKPAEHVAFKAQIEGGDNTSPMAFGLTGMDGTADSRIVDMYVDLTYLEGISARIGQFALPNSYELNTNEFDLETINYSIGAGMFGVRDRGIMLFGKPIPEFGWSAWGANGEGAITGASNNTDDAAIYGLQADWNPMQNLGFKLWGMMQQDSVVNDKLDAIGLGVNYTYEGFHLFGEYNTATDEAAAGDIDTDEWFINGSYKIPETNVQVVLKYDDLQQDQAGVSLADVQILTAGVNWNFEKNARVQLTREFVDGDNNDNTDLLLSVRF